MRSKTDGFGKTIYPEDAADNAIIDALADLADRRGEAMASLALAWQFTREPVAAPIIGATKPHHISDAARALEIELAEEEIASLEAPYRPKWPNAMGMPLPGDPKVSVL
ncbi:aldo/keto reductase [Erythrobacter sp.]|uniref:aldo/keto reductase n=1 Tax=Erythrobacter sp. TaxID=1042 RepID=UPI00345BABB3